MSQITANKIVRIRNGGRPRVLDLFAGCGGISLGFQAAGFTISAAVEIDPFATASHALNFFDESEFAHHSMPIDITQTEPDMLAQMLNLGQTDSAIDIIVGGPPCQAFARVGRAKLREIDAHPEAYIHDPRGNLYLRYLAYVRAFKPIALLMENVPDMLNYGGHNIAEEVSDSLADLGYICHYTLLNAAHYGVPEMRERMFLVAFAEGINPHEFFPQPTNYHELPRGYEGTRQVALQTVINSHSLENQQNLFKENTSFMLPPAVSADLPPAITAKQALEDLPPITDHLTEKLKRGARRFDVMVPYQTCNLEGISDYATLMRTWPGHENLEGISDHVIRYLPRDYDIFEKMKPGDQYPEAYAIAIEMFNKKLKSLQRKGKKISEGCEEYDQLFKKIVPPYDPEKFPNKWRKMEPDAPARTLMAHLGKDSYSHIHYDSQQKRTISVREAARLQSFPDGFKFSGTMNPAFKQIGNAVPPLLAKALAANMLREIKGGNG
ncbi:DNA (cytosine-5)-methyltransferase 1 [Sporobacter termitidis DSM 10068]|uniref:DNA (cytosine-5-)-methyltransferase n=1 Tax=Sporobacter termitidis DSM 10068 TaxID=1123282 RepID=A0A1M5U2N0_9FIRM|nr:DNA cytosine methyltransferase [Sporobacter termitidis]SHH57229.1 DNA (cytosine-5)-methyltransferase 1 [Sporobacter termitidis DSM 10068]